MTHKLDSQGQGTSTASRGVRRKWAAAFAAAFAVVLVVGVVFGLSNRGGDPSEVIAPATTTTQSSPTVADQAVVVVPDTWDRILAETKAKAAPSAATCSASSDPSAPGPVDQARPAPGWVSNQAAAFDRHTGRIIYVDLAGETWTFDVCTSTWQEMSPEGAPVTDEDLALWDDPSYALGELVYDVDSDRTIAFGSENLAVYDANANTWTRKEYPPELERDGNGAYNPVGALYDPVSGLVVTGNTGDVAVYDVDADNWTFVGAVEQEGEQERAYRFLTGYSAATDQLIFQGYAGGRNSSPNHSGVVVDVRAGGVATLPRPGPDGAGAYGWFVYATDTDTAFVGTAGGQVCRFDPVTLDWNTCFVPPDGLGSPSKIYSAKTMVGDSINNRLILMHGNDGPWASPGTTEVWAIDLDTGEWIQLLGPLSE